MKKEEKIVKYTMGKQLHETKSGWCCACGADIARMENCIKEAYERVGNARQQGYEQGLKDAREIKDLKFNKF